MARQWALEELSSANALLLSGDAAYQREASERKAAYRLAQALTSDIQRMELFEAELMSRITNEKRRANGS